MKELQGNTLIELFSWSFEDEHIAYPKEVITEEHVEIHIKPIWAGKSSASFKKILGKLKATESHIYDHMKTQDDIITEAEKIKTSSNNIQSSNKKVIAKLEEFLL